MCIWLAILLASHVSFIACLLQDHAHVCNDRQSDQDNRQYGSSAFCICDSLLASQPSCKGTCNSVWRLTQITQHSLTSSLTPYNSCSRTMQWEAVQLFVHAAINLGTWMLCAFDATPMTMYNAMLSSIYGDWRQHRQHRWMETPMITCNDILILAYGNWRQHRLLWRDKTCPART